MANKDKVYFFTLSLTSEEYLKYYQGKVSRVNVRDHSGLVIEFPAKVLMQFVTRDGIRGQFRLLCHEDNSFKSIERVSQ